MNVPGSKSLSEDMSKHLRKELEALISEKFVDADGKRWSQERIGERLDCSQTQVSDMLAGKKFGPTALVAMSRESGKTIDELLGPTAPAYRRAHKHGVIVGKTLELMQRIDDSGYGWSGKNHHIPRLIKELRTLLETRDDEAIQAELRAATKTATAIAEAKPQKRRRTG